MGSQRVGDDWATKLNWTELWCWWRLLRVSWTARRSNQFILKEISPGCSLEGLVFKLKLQYFGHLMWRTDSFEKILMDWGQEEKRTTEGEMVGWHHRLNWRECEQAPGVGDGQGSLACCSPWGWKESDTTWMTELNWVPREATSLFDYSFNEVGSHIFYTSITSIAWDYRNSIINIYKHTDRQNIRTLLNKKKINGSSLLIPVKYCLKSIELYAIKLY